MKFNIYEDIKPESEKWMKNYLYLLEHDLKTVIINQRQNHFAKKNVILWLTQYGKDEIEREVFAHSLIQPETAVKNGLVDGIMNLDDILNEKFSGVKVLEINKKQQLDKYKLGMQALGLVE